MTTKISREELSFSNQRASNLLAGMSILIFYTAIAVCALCSITPGNMVSSLIAIVGVAFPISSFILLPKDSKDATLQTISLPFVLIPSLCFWLSFI